ncbi:hypothetical protein GCM10010353_37120 [Streptomyces chryseus]|nr:hypothetical protein GCM10010353_37120 [Streptomyces chryseus]
MGDAPVEEAGAAAERTSRVTKKGRGGSELPSEGSHRAVLGSASVSGRPDARGCAARGSDVARHRHRRAVVVSTARTVFQNVHGPSKLSRTAPGSAIRSAAPAAASSLFSGTFAADVTAIARTYRARPAVTHRLRGVRRCCQAETAVRIRAPKKPAKNTGFSITSLMFRMTSMDVRSSLRRSAGITAQANAYQTPATSPVVTVAAARTPCAPDFCVMPSVNTRAHGRDMGERRKGMSPRPDRKRGGGGRSRPGAAGRAQWAASRAARHTGLST